MISFAAGFHCQFRHVLVPAALLLPLITRSAEPAAAPPGIHNVISFAARPLPLSAARLTGGPLKNAEDLDARYLLALEPDRIMAGYRLRAGLEPRAKGYGGWDSVNGKQLTGHIGGHYLSAVSLMCAATGDPRFKERADYLVTYAGLRDAYRFTGNRQHILNPMTAARVQGKSKVTVKIQATNGNESATVFGVRMIRPARGFAGSVLCMPSIKNRPLIVCCPRPREAGSPPMTLQSLLCCLFPT